MDILFKLFLLSITSFDTHTNAANTSKFLDDYTKTQTITIFSCFCYFCLFVCWYFVQLRLFASKPSSQLRYNEIKDNKEKLKIPQQQQQQQNIAKKINKTQTERKKRRMQKKQQRKILNQKKQQQKRQQL